MNLDFLTFRHNVLAHKCIFITNFDIHKEDGVGYLLPRALSARVLEKRPRLARPVTPLAPSALGGTLHPPSLCQVSISLPFVINWKLRTGM